MSSLKRNVFLSVFVAAMSATAAFAADLPAPPVIEYEPETPIEIGSGWYLRGDVGFAAYSGGDATWLDNTGTPKHFRSQKYDLGGVIGVGAGYYFSENWRADITLDHRINLNYGVDGHCGGTCFSYEQGTFDVTTLMLNGYYDFAAWKYVTPYIGAGVGASYLHTRDHETSSSGTFVFKDKGKASFAWNVMAGGVVDLEDGWKLDANYRFVSLGKAETGRPTTDSSQSAIKFENLYAHDFRVGLRYDLN
ncbi:outer membrane protein [Cohaesibacter celericrescens]|nr:outer membrane protein [Cohaesibacter celericrescens]